MKTLRRLFFDSRRREERVAVSNSCYIKLPPATMVSVCLKDLSLNGLSFEFSPATPLENHSMIEIQLHTLKFRGSFRPGRIVSQTSPSESGLVRFSVEFLAPLQADELQTFLQTQPSGQGQAA